MKSEEFKVLQNPLKEKYRSDPATARVTLRASGRLGEGVTCKVDTGRTMVETGLHPATGGSGMAAYSGDMLLESLVACAGVTLSAVATALGIPVRDATVTAEGALDFRGTLAVAKDARVGFKDIRLRFDVDTRMLIQSSSPPCCGRRNAIAWFIRPCGSHPILKSRCDRGREQKGSE